MAETTFTPEQSQLVTESWQMLKDNAAQHSFTFFSKIFEIAPPAKQLFSFLRENPDAPLDKIPKLKAHALNVWKLTGDSAVMLGKVGAIDALHPKLKELGKKHVGYGVVTPHFQVVKTAFLETISSVLPEDWSSEKKEATKAAWSEAFDELAQVMVAEMDAVRSGQA
ncbi:hypothetical protein R1sor_017711 [Riccia sorocarpa]|uniref:Globin domain-containing protein n=1 Tax=Riccia sorocarpa TaxID=122646 RepID=A0ABD3IAX6_9MARC